MNRHIFICLSLSMIFAAFFVADMNGAFEKSRHPIAYISESKHTVRRLPNNELTWKRVREGTSLELGDTISTGYRAQAKIIFKAGGVLILDEGSMVVLGGDLEQLRLNPVTGDAHLQIMKEANSKIKVVQRKTCGAMEVSTLDDKVILNLSPPESSPKKVEFKEILPGI